MSVAVIATYLTFFPVTVNALRGLMSPGQLPLELMRSYAATDRATLVKLRFPASVPYLIPALKLAATASVVGAIVGEISAGLRGGLGRLIIDYSQQYLTDPARLYCAVIAAGVLGHPLRRAHRRARPRPHARPSPGGDVTTPTSPVPPSPSAASTRCSTPAARAR